MSKLTESKISKLLVSKIEDPVSILVTNLVLDFKTLFNPFEEESKSEKGGYKGFVNIEKVVYETKKTHPAGHANLGQQNFRMKKDKAINKYTEGSFIPNWL